MHELSVAIAIIERVEAECERRALGTVKTVHLQVGLLSGVDARALNAAFNLAIDGTRLRDSCLRIESVPVTAYCRSCDLTQQVASLIGRQCATCGSTHLDLVTGRELDLIAVEVEEENAPPLA